MAATLDSAKKTEHMVGQYLFKRPNIIYKHVVDCLAEAI